jgi:hypothetical protein
MQRVKGQEIFLNIVVNNKIDDKLGPFLDLEVEFRKEIIEGEYIGQTTTYFDDVFKGCQLKAKYHMRNAKMLKLIDMDIRRARYQAGALVRLDVVATIAFPGLALPWKFLDIRLDSHPVTVSDRKAYLEGTLTMFCSEQPTLPANI